METSTSDFRIKPLREDRDALLLIGLAVVVALVTIALLAFLPDKAWDRLEERSQILWGAGLAIVPVLLLGWQRYRLRRDSVQSLGVASSAPLTIEALPSDYFPGVLDHAEIPEGGEALPAAEG